MQDNRTYEEILLSRKANLQKYKSVDLDSDEAGVIREQIRKDDESLKAFDKAVGVFTGSSNDNPSQPDQIIPFL